MLKVTATVRAISITSLIVTASYAISSRAPAGQNANMADSQCEKSLRDGLTDFKTALETQRNAGEDTNPGINGIQETLDALKDPRRGLGLATALANHDTFIEGDGLAIMGLSPACQTYGRDRLNKLPVNPEKESNLRRMMNFRWLKTQDVSLNY